jgi:hypothetical protein|uniref:Uncharacterized protein n=1 Tax=Zea mays TaxID=4577 RepID=C4IZ38_MAIZE|nr:unknown [Zea mays]
MTDSWSRSCSKDGSSGGKANKQSKWLEQHVYHNGENSKRRPRLEKMWPLQETTQNNTGD